MESATSIEWAAREFDEWLEPDGRGGFASGCVDLTRTRRYHGLLLAATRPPGGRVLLVAGLEAWLERDGERIELVSQRCADGFVRPDARARVQEFRAAPWPRWRLDAGGGSQLDFELCVPRGLSCVCLSWRASAPLAGARLCVRPLLAARDPHALHVENSVLNEAVLAAPGGVAWRPYEAWPAVRALSSGAYTHAPLWRRGFELPRERERGYDAREDLWSPGEFAFALEDGDAVLVLHADVALDEDRNVARELAARLRGDERVRRGGAATRLERAAEAYLVSRGDGASIIAGYPWFGDWGRDTFIALRGLCLSTGRFGLAESILREWSRTLVDGLLPNRFADGDGAPEFNSVDAALWFVVAACELEEQLRAAGGELGPGARDELHEATHAILSSYSRGARHGIRVDDDGLLAAGEPGLQLTWMDARVDGRVITARIGKPVEIQALWLNATRLAAERDGQWKRAFERGLRSFLGRFWNDARGSLFDVVDVDHVRGQCDDSLRPNQLLAVGGLPLQLLARGQARSVVDVVERSLWTPLGPRSLAPDDPRYRGRYWGGPNERDEAYHQGTVWPWLSGAFIEAWVRSRGATAQARAQARDLYFLPLLEHLDRAGLGHVSEVADGDAPHRPGGCPFQAWSVAELLRVERRVLAPRKSPPRRRASSETP